MLPLVNSGKIFLDVRPQIENNVMVNTAARWWRTSIGKIYGPTGIWELSHDYSDRIKSVFMTAPFISVLNGSFVQVLCAGKFPLVIFFLNDLLNHEKSQKFNF